MMRKNDNIPMPPNHSVTDRQKRMLCGIASSPEKTVIPVVVNPLVDSKNAFSQFEVTPLIIKGMAPIADEQIQPRAQRSIDPAMSSFDDLKYHRARVPRVAEPRAGMTKGMII